jgi:hypothetical protein
MVFRTASTNTKKNFCIAVVASAVVQAWNNLL